MRHVARAAPLFLLCATLSAPATASAADAEQRCAKLGTKDYKLRDIRVRDASCRDARDLAVAYAAVASDEPSLLRPGSSNVNGYTCTTRRVRRVPLHLRVRCVPAPPASPDVQVPPGRIRFLVLAR